MGRTVSILLFVLVVILNMGHESVGQSGGCTTALISLSSCLSYITDGDDNTGSTPPSSCCSRLASVVQSQPQCLCSALNGGAAASLGVTINQTRALALPTACNLQTPPPSRCNDGSGGSGGAPAISPVSWAANSPAVVEPSDGEEQLGKLAPTMATPSWVEEGSFPSAITSKNVPIGGIIPSMAARSLISNTPFYDLIITMPAIILTALNICTLINN